MAQEFENLTRLGIVRAILNEHAREINALKALIGVDTTASVFSGKDNEFTLFDGDDETRIMQFVLDDITPGTNIELRVPDDSGTLALYNLFAGAEPGFVPSSDGNILKLLRGNGTFAQLAYSEITGTPTIPAPYVPPETPTIGRPWQAVASGDDMYTAINTGTLGSFTAAAGTMRLFPFYAPCDISFSKLKIGIISNFGNGATCKLGVYDSDPDTGLPHAFMSETGNIPMGASGFYSDDCSVTLEKYKTYWFFGRFSGTATVRTWGSAAVPAINGGLFTGTARCSITHTLAYATATPSVWAWDTAEIDDVGPPAIVMVV
jgi:hypothetical protein